MKKNKAILIILTFLCFSAYGNQTLQVPKVQDVVLGAVKKQVQKECPSCRVELIILNSEIIDDIAVPDKVLSDHWKGQTNLVLQLGKKTRVVTAEIRWLDQVVVAHKNIKQGQLISEASLRVVEKDVTFLKTSYSQSKNTVHGMVSRRVFQRGQIIDESMLKKPLAIRYGQPVKLEVYDGALSVTILAKARGAGAVGERIPVYIPKTRKKVFAKIINESLVRAL